MTNDFWHDKIKLGIYIKGGTFMKKLKKPVSFLLSIVMVASLFSIVPVTAFAAEGTYYDIDDDGKLTLHAGTINDPFCDFKENNDITSVYAEPGVVLSGDCSEMFSWGLNIKSIDLSNADMSGVTSVEKIFEQCYQCKTIELPKSNVSFGTSAAGMFYNCNALEELDLSGCDTSKVLSMSEMFSHCRSIKNLDLTGFNTASVKNMQKMFYDCYALGNVDLSTFDTKKVTNMESMFSDCPRIKTLDLSSFDTSMVGSFDYMFQNSTEGNNYQLTTIYVGDKWNVQYSDGSYASGEFMFRNCFGIKGGQGTVYYYDSQNPYETVGIKYAHIDGGESNPGYLTRLDKVTVRWKNYDGSLLKTERIDKGAAASYSGDTPVKPDTDEYHFTFSGWSPEPGVVTQDTDYTAQFTETKREYTITWKSENGTVIDTTDVAYGDIPAHADAVKPDDGNIVYTFTGWIPEPSAVTGDAEYTAAFTSSEKSDWGMLQSYIDRAPDNTETTIALTKNYTADTNDYALVVPENKIINLDLGEFTLDRGLTDKSAVSNGNVITNNGSLTVTGSGVIKGGNNSANGGAIVNNGTLTVSGITVSGNQSSKDGGAIYNSGTLNITGGSLYGNTAHDSGGAISAHNGTINISGGEIRNNHAQYSHGGGIYIGGNAVVNLTGGSVIYNRATNNNSQGGGILNNSVLNVSGSPIVNGNSTGKVDNIYLRPDHVINITGTLDENASLGVTIEGGNGGVITSGLQDSSSADSFFSDNSGLHVVLNGNNETELVKNTSQGVFAGETLSLNGNISVNFYIDPTPAGVKVSDIQNGDKEISVYFTWATTPAPLTDLSDFDIIINKDNYDTYFDDAYGYFKVSCDIAVAEMSCNIKAGAWINNINAEKTYSVREYGSTVLNPDSDFSINYKSKYGETKYNQLVDLVTKMLDYGAKAQKVFGINTDDLANSIITNYNMGSVTKDMCLNAVREANEMSQGDNMNDVAEAINAEYYSTSLIYLSKCTLRHYFTFNTYPEAYEAVKDDFNSSKAPYYYVEKTDIPAAELDKLQTFTLGGEEYYYSALNFAGAMIESEKASEDSKNLAMALYWYNQAANEFFK